MGKKSLAIILVILVVVGTYFVYRSPNQFSPNSEVEIIAKLQGDWQVAQAGISFKPTFPPGNTVWGGPTAVQFIGKNIMIISFEDGHNAGLAIMKYEGEQFEVLETFQNQGDFQQTEWQILMEKYGSTSYAVSTYTYDLVRSNEIVSFQSLTKVPENIFVEEYWK